MGNLAILDRAAARLMQKTSAETNQSLAGLLMQQCGLSIISNVKNIFNDNGTVTEEYYPPTLKGECEFDGLPLAINAYELAMTPAPETEIVKAILKLRVRTATRATDTIDFQLLLQVWAEDLAKYPADIVIESLKPNGKWFPDYHDIVEYCERETRRRADVLNNLKYLHKYGPPRKHVLEIEKKPTPEEREKMLAMLAELKKEIVAGANPNNREVA